MASTSTCIIIIVIIIIITSSVSTASAASTTTTTTGPEVEFQKEGRNCMPQSQVGTHDKQAIACYQTYEFIFV